MGEVTLYHETQTPRAMMLHLHHQTHICLVPFASTLPTETNVESGTQRKNGTSVNLSDCGKLWVRNPGFGPGVACPVRQGELLESPFSLFLYKLS